MSAKGRKMLNAEAISYGVGQRASAWLRQAYPGDSRAKRIARDFECDERTAKSWLAGERPANRHWDQMVARWGRAFLAFVYQPYFDWAEQERLDAELAALQSVAARLEEARGAHASTPDVDRAIRAVAHEKAPKARAVVAGARLPLRATAGRR